MKHEVPGPLDEVADRVEPHLGDAGAGQGREPRLVDRLGQRRRPVQVDLLALVDAGPEGGPHPVGLAGVGDLDLEERVVGLAEEQPAEILVRHLAVGPDLVGPEEQVGVRGGPTALLEVAELRGVPRDVVDHDVEGDRNLSGQRLEIGPRAEPGLDPVVAEGGEAAIRAGGERREHVDPAGEPAVHLVREEIGEGAERAPHRVGVGDELGPEGVTCHGRM